jgi:CBS domain-containing protein
MKIPYQTQIEAVSCNYTIQGETAMATVRDMIRKKGSEVYSILPNSTVYEALEAMAAHNTGALLVMEGDKMVGILSERDCVRKVDLQRRDARETKVSEIMTKDVITVSCDQPLEECMHLMQDKGIRHLPVYDNQELMGFVSVRDMLGEMIEMQQIMLHELERYITGGGR